MMVSREQDDIVGTVDIHIDQGAISCLKQPSRNAPSSILLSLVRMLPIKKTAIVCLALFLENNLDASHLGLVAQHLRQPGMWNGGELLIPGRA